MPGRTRNVPFEAYIDEANDILVGRGTGLVTTDEILAAYDPLMRATDGLALAKNILSVYDPSCVLTQLDKSSMMRFKAQIDAWRILNPAAPGRTAMVAPTRLHIALANLWRALVEADPQLKREVRVFPDEAEALAWLNGARPLNRGDRRT